jgi:hypothetical protein
MPFTTFRRRGLYARVHSQTKNLLWCLNAGIKPAPTCMLLSFALVFLGACRQKMADQPRYDPYDQSTFFPDMLSARPLPAGAISRDYVAMRTDQMPFPMTLDVIHRGRERYDIFCSPCHGYTGYGDGMVARRGFRRQPASFHTDDLRSAPPEQFFDVMTNGFGAMPSYAYQVGSNDRWAIAAYIRALQVSQWTSAGDVPPAELQKLETGPR